MKATDRLIHTAQGERNGIPLQKGYQLNQQYLESVEQPLGDAFSFWSAYPDVF